MRNLVLGIAAAAAVLAAASTPSATYATPLGFAAALRLAAADSVRTIESVACYGFGWRGWGVYPGLHPACLRAAPAYVAPGYVAAAPVYAAPAYPIAGRCWIPATPDGRPGYWAAC
jgi:hypothetical protein